MLSKVISVFKFLDFEIHVCHTFLFCLPCDLIQISNCYKSQSVALLMLITLTVLDYKMGKNHKLGYWGIMSIINFRFKVIND